MRTTLLSLLLLAFAAACDSATGDEGGTPSGGLVGQPLAAMSFRDPAGGQVDTAAFQGSADAKLLLLNAAAGWCTVCQAEAPELAAWHDEYAAQGLEIVYTLFEDSAGVSPTDTFAKGWCDSLGLPFACLVDEGFATTGLGQYFDRTSAPLNLLVRTLDMSIIYADTGYDADRAALMEQKIRLGLGL